LPGYRKFPVLRGFGAVGGFAFLGSPARGGKIEESVAGRPKETACEATPASAEECEAPVGNAGPLK